MSVKAQRSLPTHIPLNEEFSKRFRRRARLDYQHVIERVIEAADPQPGDGVLDIMSEDVTLALTLVPRVTPGHIVTIHPEEAILQQAYKQAQACGMEEHIDWRMVAIEDLAFPDQSFDMVTCTLSFRLVNTDPFLAQVYRLLVPGGRLLITEALVPPTKVNDWRYTVRSLYYKHYEKDPLEAKANFYSADDVTARLRRAGFEPVIIRGLHKPMTQHSWVFSLIKGTKPC